MEKDLMQTQSLNIKEIEIRANEILKQHGLFSVPVDPVTLANKLGIRVNNAVFSDTTLSGLIARRGNKVSILVNQADPPYRKRFTIAHELAHHFLHLLTDGEFVDNTIDLFRGSESDKTNNVEVQANQFAAALLMPAELVKEEFKKNNGDIEILARLFNVSEEAMGYRLQRLRLA
jgi:Zn-dependent peptidase ImmA (M78 family)